MTTSFVLLTIIIVILHYTLVIFVCQQDFMKNVIVVWLAVCYDCNIVDKPHLFLEKCVRWKTKGGYAML